VFVCCIVCEESNNRQKSFRFIKFSFSFDNVWFHTSVMAMLHVFVRCQDYLAIERFPTILKQQPQYWKIDMNLCGLPKKNWTSYQDGKDWRFCQGFQNNDERWIKRRLWRETLIMWSSQVLLYHQLLQCICQRYTFLCMWVYLQASAKF